MKFSLKRFILGGIIAASITGIIISCETVDPATMKTVSSIDYSPIRLIDANKGAPGQTVVINVPNTNVNGNQGEVDVTNVDNGEENTNPAAGEQTGGIEDNQTANPEGVGSENENTGTDNTDSTTTEPSGNKTESGNAGDNENVSGGKTDKSDSPVSGPSKNTASGGSNNTGSTQTAAESARERVLRQARENIDNGKYSQAITALNTWLKSNPDDGDAKNLLEEAKEKQAQANAEAAEKARQDKLKQARDYIDAGKYSNAITVLNGLLKTDPNDAEAKKLLDEAKEKQSAEEKAKKEAADKAAAEKKAQAEAAAEKKAAEEKAKKEAAEKAAAEKKAAEEKAKQEAEAKAAAEKKAAEEKAKKEAAEKAAAEKKAADEKAKQEAANKARQDKLKQAKDYIDSGKYSNAISLLNGLLKTDPNDAEAKKLLDEAKEKQEKANADAAAKARADKLKQAKDYIDGGKYTQAISLLNGLLKTDPNDAEAKALLEEAKAKQEKANADAAAKARQDKLKQAKDYIDGGKYAQAISVLNGLLKSDPNDAEAKKLLEEAQAKQAEEQKAKQEAAAKKAAEDKAKKEAADKAAAEKKAAEEKAKKEAAEKAAAEKKAAEEKAKQEAAEKAAAEKKAAEEKAKQEAEAKAAAEKKAAEEKAKQEAAEKAAAEKKAAEEEKARKEAEAKANQEALVELQKFTTDWESPQLSDIEDCGYFYTSPEFGQFDMIEGEFSKKSGYIKSAYGFVFGYTRPSSTGKLYNYIRFEINTDGEYALYKWDGKTYTDLVEPNDEGTAYFYPSTAINKGYNAINKLKIQVNDGKYDVYINGRLIKKGIEFIPNGTYGVMGFFSVGQVTQEDLPYTPVVVSYRITDAVLHNPKNGK